jgi:hypothetical protein
MKKLNHKILLQKLKMYVDIETNKIGLHLVTKLEYQFGIKSKNRIGFWRELYEPNYNNNKDNFYNYSHLVDKINKKLYKKYPTDVYKKDYKEWLKKSNANIKKQRNSSNTNN